MLRAEVQGCDQHPVDAKADTEWTHETAKQRGTANTDERRKPQVGRHNAAFSQVSVDCSTLSGVQADSPPIML